MHEITRDRPYGTSRCDSRRARQYYVASHATSACHIVLCAGPYISDACMAGQCGNARERIVLIRKKRSLGVKKDRDVDKSRISSS